MRDFIDSLLALHIPFSVIIPVINLEGVTSKPGLRHLQFFGTTLILCISPFSSGHLYGLPLEMIYFSIFI